mmetsp:Transcript_19428/g.40056  ORF Transcript_19428/g.40056 Transcript_19428/m.40056 type:complete len:476 (+) Transcript_19428:24-1451(+)
MDSHIHYYRRRDLSASLCVAIILTISLCADVSSSSPSNTRNSGGNSKRNESSFSPIRELGPSLAASVAGGTVIAVRSFSPLSRRSPSYPPSTRRNRALVDCQDELFTDAKEGELGPHEDCLVILFRSPSVPTDKTNLSREGGKGKYYVQSGKNLTLASVIGRSSQSYENMVDVASNMENDENSHYVDCNNSHKNFDDSNHVDTQTDLSFLPNGPINFPIPTANSNSNNLRILNAPTGLLIAATGFAPDTQHILDVAAGRILSRLSVYDSNVSGSGRSGKSGDPHRLVKEDVSLILRDAAMLEGGRPLGVQLLVVGHSALSLQSSSSSLEIYTIDPSGGWKNWCGIGTAIGKGTEKVRSSLFRLFSSGGVDEFKSSSWEMALEKAICVAIDALDLEYDDYNSVHTNRICQRSEQKIDAGNYGAVVIFGKKEGKYNCNGGNASRCAVVSPVLIEKYYKRCFETVVGLRMKKKTSKRS